MVRSYRIFILFTINVFNLLNIYGISTTNVASKVYLTTNSDVQIRRKFYSREKLLLHCEIKGSPMPTYQWYFAPINKKNYIEEVFGVNNFTKIDNANTYTLELDGSKTKETHVRKVYYCAAKNPMGTINSDMIIVQKMVNVDIKMKYVQHSVYSGEKFAVVCKPQPDYILSFLKFQEWQLQLARNHVINLPKTKGRYSVISYTKYPQLHIRNITENDLQNIHMRCIFKNIIGKESFVIGKYERIQRLPYNPSSVPIVVKCEGETINVYIGSTVELPWCTNSETSQIEWYKINPITHNLDLIDLSKKSKFHMFSKRYGNLQIRNLTIQDNGKYVAMKKYKGTELKAEFQLNIFYKPTINLNKQLVEIKLNSNVTFECTSVYKSQFYWHINGKLIKTGYNNGNVKIINDASGRKSILKIKSVNFVVAGIYQCTASMFNKIFKNFDHQQKDATLKIIDFAPIITQQSPRPEKTRISHIQLSTNTHKLECQFSSNPLPSITWYLNGKKIDLDDDNIRITMEKDPHSIYNTNTHIELVINSHHDIEKYGGEYKAIAVNQFGQSYCTFIAFIDDIKLKLRLPREQVVTMEQNIVLSCFFLGNNMPSFQWYRFNDDSWDTLPTSQKTVLRNDKYNLLINNVIKEEDEGIYKCTAEYKGQKVSAQTRIIVANPPRIQKAGAKKTQDISKENVNKCSISNSADTPWYAWWTFKSFKNNKTVDLDPAWTIQNMKKISIYYSIDPMKSRRYTSGNKVVSGIPTFLQKYPNTGPDLIIKERSSSDEREVGVFTCQIKNPVGIDSYQIVDNTKGVEFEQIPKSTTDAIIGNEIKLHCKPKPSKLNPFVSWKIRGNGIQMKDVNEIKEYKGRIYYFKKNGTLVMKNIKKTDPIELICYIISSLDKTKNNSRVAHIDIRVPATIQPLPAKIELIAMKSYNLTCNVYGDKTKLMIRWFYRQKTNNHWKKLSENCLFSKKSCLNNYEIAQMYNTFVTYNRTASTVKLFINEAISRVAGEYRCEAENSFNTIPQAITTQVTVISRPSKVENLASDGPNTARSLQIRWNPPHNNGNKPIQSYKIQYCELESKMGKLNTDSCDMKTIKVGSAVLKYNIEKLKPNRLYEIRLSAINMVGESEQNIFSIQTDQDKPERPVQNLKASTTKPHEILISWRPPDIEYQNGEILTYNVCYQKMTGSSDSKRTVDSSVELEKLSWKNDKTGKPGMMCEESRESSKAISNLQQFTVYAIRVNAVNTKGESPPAFTKVRTLEDLPQAAPSSLICEKRERSIDLKWNPPSKHTLNGVLIGYVINIYEPNQYGDESKLKSINVQGSNNYKIDDLKPNTEYSIKIMAENRKGLGPAAELICVTSESQPGPPESLKAIEINNTCALVSWLHTKTPNGKINKYCATLINFDSFVKPKKCMTPDFSKPYNYMIICSTTDISEFNQIEVYAVNNRHKGIEAEISSDIIKRYSAIISYSGEISVSKYQTVILHCETTKNLMDDHLNIDDPKVVWKTMKDPNNRHFTKFSNDSILVKNIMSDLTYECSYNSETISYSLKYNNQENGRPNKPQLLSARVTENSIFISWISRGTSQLNAPIISYNLTWSNKNSNTNLPSGMYNVGLSSSKIHSKLIGSTKRNFYLNNVTCASDFEFRIRAINKHGSSDYSDYKYVRTTGKRPELADNSRLLPKNYINSSSVKFNLKEFRPGENCSAIRFIIEISLAQQGRFKFNSPEIRKNISVYELQDSCCYLIKNLHPLTNYQFQVFAINYAGYTVSRGNFRTIGTYGLTIQERNSTHKPSMGFTGLLILVLMIILIFVILIIIAGFLYFLRKKVNKQPNQPIHYQEPQNGLPIHRIEPDNMSLESNGEPSPYAVYQPDTAKPSSQWSKSTNSNGNILHVPSSNTYNYSSNQYNKVQYGYNYPPPTTAPLLAHQQSEEPTRYKQITANMHGDMRRSNSAECLSSNASKVSGIGDLENVFNIDPKPYDTNRNDRYSGEFPQDYHRQFRTLRPTRGRENSLTYGERSRYGQQQSQPYDTQHNRDYYRGSNANNGRDNVDYSRHRIPSSSNSQNRPTYGQQISMPERNTYQIPYGPLPSRNRSDSGNVHVQRGPQLQQQPQHHQQSQQPVMNNPYNSYYGGSNMSHSNNNNSNANMNLYGSRKNSSSRTNHQNSSSSGSGSRNSRNPSYGQVPHQATSSNYYDTRRVIEPSSNSAAAPSNTNPSNMMRGNRNNSNSSNNNRISGEPPENIYTDRVVLV